MVAVRGRLEPEVGELLIQALNAARQATATRWWSTLTRRTFPRKRLGVWLATPVTW